jgi:hypothetical protein
MTEKITPRRRYIDNQRKNNENIVPTAKKGKQYRTISSHLLMRNKFSLRSSIYLIISLTVLFSLYKILIGFISIEYTNVPIDLPKLVNETIPERFWGTYR